MRYSDPPETIVENLRYGARRLREVQEAYSNACAAYQRGQGEPRELRRLRDEAKLTADNVASNARKYCYDLWNSSLDPDWLKEYCHQTVLEMDRDQPSREPSIVVRRVTAFNDTHFAVYNPQENLEQKCLRFAILLESLADILEKAIPEPQIRTRRQRIINWLKSKW